MKYKVGDKVVVRSWEDMEKQFGLDWDGDIKTRCPFVTDMRKFCGKEMTIREVFGHCYLMRETHWNFSEDTIEKKHSRKIVITADGNETLARLFEDGKVVKSATAKCAPEDEFDFSIGARLAFDRLVESTAEKKEEYYNGKVVCIREELDMTVGKIYEFVNGNLKDDVGDTRPMGYSLKSLEDGWARRKFIPLVD